jgi:MFS family permease
MSIKLSDPPTISTASPTLVTAATTKPRFYPGWIMLGIAAAVQFMSAPGQSYSVAAFIDPMLNDLGFLRTEYATAYLIATLVSGITLPFMGRLLDAYGARILLPSVAVLLGLACLWMSRVDHLIGLVIGFSFVRCLGQGTLSLVSTWIVGEWFHNKRGIATGLVGLGGTFSVMSIPQVNDMLIQSVGWRNTWLLLAVAVWVVLVIPGAFFLRNRPEDIGLLPDGQLPEDEEETDYLVDSYASNTAVEETTKKTSNLIAPTEDSWTVGQAMRCLTFWKLNAVVCTSALVGTGLIFHQVSLLAEHGVNRTEALGLIGIQAVVGTFSSLLFGYLTDRYQSRYLMAFAMLFFFMAVCLLIVMPIPAMAILYSGLLGLHGGIIRSTGTVVWINYYGRLHQGAVRGAAFSIMIFASALGPVPLALAKDYFGGYNQVLMVFAVLPIITGCWVLTAKPPQKEPALTV